MQERKLNQDEVAQVSDPAVEACLRRILEKLDVLERDMKSAFVGGDYDGHKRAHDQFIADLQTRRELKRAVLEQVVKGSVWAGLIFIGTAMWQAVKGRLL